MNFKLPKQHLTDSLKQSLLSHPQVLSAWIGGSTATGYEDELSDIDIVTICKDPKRPFQIIEETLNSTSHPILKTWTVEDSPFKGLHQKFYILDQTPDSFYIDAGVYTSLNPKDYEDSFNTARHGTPVILFDKTNILAQASLNPKLESSQKVQVPNWSARFEVIFRTFSKEALRGKYIDSFLFYQRLIAMLIQLLRLKHSPQKHDFGFRYLYRDLPQAESDWIENLLKVSDIVTMQEKAGLIRKRVIELQKDFL